MRAIQFEHSGDPDVLQLGEAPHPGPPEPSECLIRVHATALNRADLLQRSGRYQPPVGASAILGLEAAGVIESVGEEVTRWTPGDRVCALLSGGGYAEYVRAPAAHLIGVPADMTMVAAAGLPEGFLTAYQALFSLAGTQPAGIVLVHAGASGVGTSAIQLCRESGIVCLVTCSAGKMDTCLSLGARQAIDYRTQSFAEAVLEATGGRGVDTIVDVIGAPYFKDNIRSLAVDGTTVILATMGGSRVDGFNIRELFAKRGRLITSTLRNRSDSYKAALVGDFLRDFGMALDSGGLAPLVDSTFEWRNASEAHRRMEANRNTGKIILTIPD